MKWDVLFSEFIKTKLKTFFEFYELLKKVLKQVFSGPRREHEIKTAIVKSGLQILPIIVISTAFTGLVITQEIAWHLRESIHAISMIPGFTGQFVLRELGVVIPALLVVSNLGAALTSEIGTMKTTDQLDALKLLKIDLVSFLVYPRFIASIFSLVCLTMFSIFVTLLFALVVASLQYNFSWLEYLNALRHFIGFKDVVCAFLKALVFGAVIPLISCVYGFNCKEGAQGVGTATTNSVVTNTLVVIGLDFVLTYVSTWILN
ncbi:MAG: ABC transporter permease [Deltaproteobacteria bacterium]|nr:ABC transporter permease [Deltaproteobacteria bacterium]